MKKVEESDAVSILEFFKDLPDPRCSINRKHLLGEIMVICICAVRMVRKRLACGLSPKRSG